MTLFLNTQAIDNSTASDEYKILEQEFHTALTLFKVEQVKQKDHKILMTEAKNLPDLSICRYVFYAFPAFTALVACCAPEREQLKTCLLFLASLGVASYVWKKSNQSLETKEDFLASLQHHFNELDKAVDKAETNLSKNIIALAKHPETDFTYFIHLCKEAGFDTFSAQINHAHRADRKDFIEQIKDLVLALVPAKQLDALEKVK